MLATRAFLIFALAVGDEDEQYTKKASCEQQIDKRYLSSRLRHRRYHYREGSFFSTLIQIFETHGLPASKTQFNMVPIPECIIGDR